MGREASPGKTWLKAALAHLGLSNFASRRRGNKAKGSWECGWHSPARYQFWRCQLTGSSFLTGKLWAESRPFVRGNSFKLFKPLEVKSLSRKKGGWKPQRPSRLQRPRQPLAFDIQTTKPSIALTTEPLISDTLNQGLRFEFDDILRENLLQHLPTRCDLNSQIFWTFGLESKRNPQVTVRPAKFECQLPMAVTKAPQSTWRQ